MSQKITDDDLKEGMKNLGKNADFDEKMRAREEEKKRRAEELEKVRIAMEEAAKKEGG